MHHYVMNKQAFLRDEILYLQLLGTERLLTLTSYAILQVATTFRKLINLINKNSMARFKGIISLTY